MISDKTVLDCFPHKEAILYNLDVAANIREKHGELDRLYNLCRCLYHLQNGNINKAVRRARQADYSCMARAIEIHFKKE